MSRNQNDRGSDETASALNIARLRGALQERSGDMPRVFISSTFKDLEVWRQAAFEAIQSLGGVGENMIYWSADDREPSDLSISRVRSSDALVLILAHRYGFIPSGSCYSITELEYRAAREANVPVLAFILDGSIPWPPDHIDWHQKDKLDRFKDTVRSDVVVKTFSSVEQLSRLITQAVSNFQNRNRDALIKKGWLKSRSLGVSLPIQIKTEPSLLVRIGSSEDEFPLLLGIKRDRDLRPHLDGVFEAMDPERSGSLSGLYDNVRQLLEEHARSHWAADRVVQVRMPNGRRDEMYVTRSDLSNFGSPLLSRLLMEPLGTEPAERVDVPRARGGLVGATEGQFESVGDHASVRDHASVGDRRLQSTGGLNRFIAVSLRDGRVYCVGQQRVANDTEWVVWRPFLFESITHHFGDALYRWLPGSACNVMSYPYLAMDHFAETISSNGEILTEVRLVVSRTSVARKIVDVANAVSLLNEQGRIHGDLKPQNVLLTAPQLSLIDDFEIAEGGRAPGWTPGWSAPEQVTRNVLSYSADVYPLGVMVSRLIGADLVGEARDYVVPAWPKGTSRHQVLYEPTPYVREHIGALAPEDVRPWTAFVRECLRFDPKQRLSRASEFAVRLLKLTEQRALRGNIEIRASEMPLIAATMPEGSDVIARVILNDAEGT